MEKFRAIVRRIGWHRRVLAAGLAGLSVLLLGAWLKAPPEGVPVVVMTTDLAEAATLSEADLELRQVPPALAPHSAITEVSAAAGRQLRQAMPAGTIVVSELLTATALADGRAVAPIYVADPQLRLVLTPGTRVWLVLADESGVEVVTADARIAVGAAPQEADDLALSTTNSAMVLVDVPQEIAPQVSALGQSGQLGVLITG